jgi:hypothetical protein
MLKLIHGIVQIKPYVLPALQAIVMVQAIVYQTRAELVNIVQEEAV